MGILARRVAKLAGAMFFVGITALGKAQIPVDPEDGAAHRPRVGHHMFRDFVQFWLYRRDERR